MMYVFQRYHPSFFHILWTFSVLYLLDIGAKWVRTHTYNPVDFPINITGSSRGDCNCEFPLDSDTKTNIERIRYSRDRLLSLGTPPPGTVNSNDCGITEHLCTHLADLNILNQPCPFHQVPKQLIKPKRWKKRGKGSKRQEHQIYSIPVIQQARVEPHTSGQTGLNTSNLRLLPKYNDKLLNISLWNARSVRHKTIQIIDNILDNDTDIFVITETWLAERDPVVVGEITPEGYSFFNFCRKVDEHGGIGIVYKSNLNIQSAPIDIETLSFEYASVTIKTLGVRLISVYRPPPSDTNQLKVSQFLEEFDAFVSEISMAPMKTLIVGDFNVHVDIPSKYDSRRFLGSLTETGFQQHIHQPTHKDGHTLDLIISRPEDNLVSTCQVLPSLGSDHNLINCTINCEKPKTIKVSCTVRNVKGIDSTSFTNDLSASLGDLDLGEGSVNEMLGKFDSSILNVLDSHAPSEQRTRSIRPRPPWFDEEISDARRKRRQREENG